MLPLSKQKDVYYKMYLEYFDKFKGQQPYLHIDETEWSYIKETFEKDDVKESLAKVG